MEKTQKKLNSLGLEVPEILLPKNISGAEMQKWPVIACDQFTQDRDYWEKAKTAAAGSPSTLNLIFPEVFLADEDAQERIEKIHSTMRSYLKDKVLTSPQGKGSRESGVGSRGFIYIERDTPYQKKRRGLIAAVDLEQYEWKPEARPLIRSTEGTVADRLPPRMDIRRGAPLELPHVLLLIDDDKESLLPALGEKVKNTAPVYDTPLMMDSGHVRGWFLDTENDFSFIAEKLDELFKRSVTRYAGNEFPFLFAVGDGNHSLAAAKGIWEERKGELGVGSRESENHPCRYALVEIENIYDPAIQFEPIHRVVFDDAASGCAGYDEIISVLSALPDFSCREVKNAEELVQLCKRPASANCFGIISEGRYALIETSAGGIATACLQPLLDKYAISKSLEIDYIHDDDEVLRIAENTARKAAGILLPPVQKAGLFETVARTGPLPRKSFSMGHSCEKRFYLECRGLI